MEHSNTFIAPKYKHIFILFCSVSALLLSSCGKKNSSFSARYARNGSGAKAVNIQQNESAHKYAEPFGLDILDAIHIERLGTPGNYTVTSTLLLNKEARGMSTQHQTSKVVATTKPLVWGDFELQVEAMCYTDKCNYYFLMLVAYKDKKTVMQAGIMKNFDDPSKDYFQWIDGDKVIPFHGSAWDTPNTIVGILYSKLK